jgi:hypothetical protein
MGGGQQNLVWSDTAFVTTDHHHTNCREHHPPVIQNASAFASDPQNAETVALLRRGDKCCSALQQHAVSACDVLQDPVGRTDNAV